MDIDMEAETDPQPKPHFARPTTTGMNAFFGDSSHGTHGSHSIPYSTQSLSRRLAPNSIGLQMTPTKMLMNQTRRSSSGIFITSMFGSRFRHLQKLHSEAFLGLNSICLPGLPMGAVFRSSLPATPVATPIHREAFQQFSEQAIRDRLCKTPSPRKTREFLTLGYQQSEPSTDQQMRSDSSCSHSGLHDLGLSDVQPMDITTPIIDDPVIEDPKGEENANGSGFGDHMFRHNDRLERNPSEVYERRLFVGNISYRVKESELTEFFQKFGKVLRTSIVIDRIKKRPKGYGFVTFKNSTDTHKVLNANPNDLYLDNRQLRVFAAEPKTCSVMKQEVGELNRQRKLEIEYRNIDSNINLVMHERRETIWTINDLDDDVLLQIFSHLNSLRDRTVAEFVCKRWHEMMIKLWSSQSHISFAETFNSFGSPETSTLFAVLKKCPNLRSINLKHTTNFLDIKALEIIAVSCPQLETLIFDSGLTTDYTLKVLSEKCQKLKDLYLNSCLKAGEKGFWWLFKNAHNLEVLEIRDNHKVNGNCFRLLTESLKSLDITNCSKIKEKGISELIGRNRTALKSLSLSSISNQIMAMIGHNLKSLTTLRVSHFRGFNDTNEPIYGFPLISGLNNLQVLEVSADLDDINNESILLIVEKCKELKELVLHLNRSVTDRSIARIPQYLPHLQKLCAFDSMISDESLMSLSGLQGLTHLEINRSPNINEPGVQSLVANCKSLSLLNLNDCENITLDCIHSVIQTIRSDPIYPELIVCFNNLRINTKKQDIKEVEDLLKARDYYYMSDYYDDYDKDYED